jgi:hypothetical protein
MDPVIKQKWCDALRSGKYKQGRGALRNCNDHFCCLGVCADLIAPDQWEGRTGFYFMDGLCSALSSKISDSINLPYPEQATLVGMNDSQLKSFNEIADYIEANL